MWLTMISMEKKRKKVRESELVAYYRIHQNGKPFCLKQWAKGFHLQITINIKFLGKSSTRNV